MVGLHKLRAGAQSVIIRISSPGPRLICGYSLFNCGLKMGKIVAKPRKDATCTQSQIKCLV